MDAGKVKILYVEDEPFLARVVKESLESRNFDVVLVSEGNGAAQAFHEYSPDICVLDVMLPQKDGFAIAREIRQKNPAIPIIFLTAKTQTRDLLQGFDAGGNDYLKKPFSMEELIVRIQNLLKITSGTTIIQNYSTRKDIQLGKYVFQPRKFELQLDDDVRKLSHREALLLGLLTKDMENPVLRQDILQTIWGDDSFYNSRNLDVYISKLRDYLSGDPRVKIITLKGVGYRISIDKSNSNL